MTDADLVKEFEGCELTVYRCSADRPTVGWGHTGPEVVDGMTVTQAEADALLEEDLAWARQAVDELVEVELTPHQRASLVSLVFNIGRTNFAASTLLRLLNAGNYEAAANQFPRWNKAGGKVVAGLTRRRQREREVFIT